MGRRDEPVVMLTTSAALDEDDLRTMGLLMGY